MRADRPGSRYLILFSLIAAVAALEPLFAHAADAAQKVARIAFIDPYSPTTSTVHATSAFWARLQELGWVQGKNLIVETRWAEGQIDRLPSLMTDVIGRKVDVIVTRGTPAAIAAKNTTSTIPIVVASMGDPVGTGLVKSLARPEGNLTGLSLQGTMDFYGKYLELLQEIVPRLSTIAIISNLDSSPFPRMLVKYLEGVAQTRGLKLRVIDVREPSALPSAFRQARHDAQAALVLADPLTITHQQEVTKLAASNRLPAAYAFLAFTDAGGLMAYGADPVVLFRRAADYVDKILRGAKPADLPVEQATQFKLVVNLRAAKALGLTIPESILLRADEVIR
jgi:putative ABC transport system substrate-binding protein